MFQWIIDLWNWLFGKKVVEAIRLTGKLFIPLFMRLVSGVLHSTWEYLRKTPAQRKEIRYKIKAGAKRDEQPVICFMFAPEDQGGRIFDPFPRVNKANLDRAADICEEAIKDGVAVIGCLYPDDSEPRWYDIAKHLDAWKIVGDRLSPLLSGVMVSMEQSEQAKGVGEMQHAIHLMKSVFPNVQHYVAHMQWRFRSKRNSRFSWCSKKSTPANATMILGEPLWQPDRGNVYGVRGLEKAYREMTGAVPRDKFVMHEYNSDLEGYIGQEQRAFLRSQNGLGVG